MTTSTQSRCNSFTYDRFKRCIEAWVKMTEILKTSFESPWLIEDCTIERGFGGSDDAPLFLRIRISSREDTILQNANVAVSYGSDDELLDVTVALDSQTAVPASSISSDLLGCIDIVLHPIFQVPVPFLFMHDRCGQPVDCHFIQAIIDCLYYDNSDDSRADTGTACPVTLLDGSIVSTDYDDEAGRHSSNHSKVTAGACAMKESSEHGSRDNKLLPLPVLIPPIPLIVTAGRGGGGERERGGGGRLSLDEHPILGTPCLSLHLCEVPEIMKLLNTHTTSTTAMHSSSITSEPTTPLTSSVSPSKYVEDGYEEVAVVTSKAMMAIHREGEDDDRSPSDFEYTRDDLTQSSLICTSSSSSSSTGKEPEMITTRKHDDKTGQLEINQQQIYGDNNHHHHNDDSDGDGGDDDELYLLRWLALVGPSIGIKVNAAMFNECADILHTLRSNNPA